MNQAYGIAIFAIISVMSTYTVLNYSTTLVGFSKVYAVTSNTTESGPNTALANTTISKPSSLEKEHKAIRSQLDKMVSSSGDTATVAKEVQSILRPHLEKEEQLLIPVLGALQPYVNGTLTDEARNQVIKISQQFKKEYPVMLDEHKKIVTALDKLEYNALRENRKDALLFIAEFKSDAINEEQVTYPATIVVGELLELKK